jgi:precorrin-6A/cobalt-precorrin-6A reductase
MWLLFHAMAKLLGMRVRVRATGPSFALSGTFSRQEGREKANFCILILGGTNEARAIAARLVVDGHDVTTSLAGVTSSPILPEGKLRVGGFGGVAGLVDYLKTHQVDVLVDATHPFAATMSRHGFEAAQKFGCSLLRFERPAWAAGVDDHWIDVPSLADAAAILPPNAVVLITSGRKDLGAFFARQDISGLVRTVEPVSEEMPANWREILDRPPQSVDSETALMRDNGITHLITKNSGGDRTRAKLDAARELGLPVIMVTRPFKPDCEMFSDVGALAKRLGTLR